MSNFSGRSQSQYQSLIQNTLSSPPPNSFGNGPPPLPPHPQQASSQWQPSQLPRMPDLNRNQWPPANGVQNRSRDLGGLQLLNGAPPSPIPSPGPSPVFSPNPSRLQTPSQSLFVPSEVQSKHRTELAALLQDDDTLNALFQATHPASLQHVATVANLTDQIKTTTDMILSKEPELTEARTRTEADLAAAKEKEKEWRTMEKEMRDTMAPYSSASLHARLGAATVEAEHVSEALAGSFLDTGHPSHSGDYALPGGVDQFVREYRRVRKIYHLRKERLERWNEDRVGGAGRLR
ncbi:hypothetical protein V1512DRAFT_258611 [Lipomyces arxii]|uniref:uncharacterized protein n=1 Tax=Lipomyces arxii TaxID=56418 RepID=UPI0034CFB8F1